jgi:hypothetical protein
MNPELDQLYGTYLKERLTTDDLPGLVETIMLQAHEIGRKDERERIEQVFKEEVPPHGLSLEDSVWLKRILNKAFH